jgi:hypothetical protein
VNRQVPDTIAIIGNGKVARHLVRYCDLVGQPYVQWSRNPRPVPPAFETSNPSRLTRFKNQLKKLFHQSSRHDLAATIARAETIVLLLPDDQIEAFIEQHPELRHKTCVHFSGSLSTSRALGCHPLMTFGNQPYTLEQYRAIPFVHDPAVDFNRLFPLFSNPTHVINAEHKVLYHALCVMAGNFSQTLWRLVADELQQMNLPRDLMAAYLQQNTLNYVTDPESSATGPFVRGDVNTINQHLAVLKGHPLAAVYQAFYDLHQPTTGPTELRSLSS